ncbi:MAG: polymer-forming cytoskeletal protein [Odoribacteraceae bacterium]|jgi:cytoskeletal protein CcmA (bactofilin family)|nr:polymer-forming cytoskeletal protein [Odoribacteraceae bacterium]
MSRDQHRSNAGARQTVILDDTEITGELAIISGDLLLLGKVNGDIKCPGRVVINEGARVSGSISCGSLDLSGTIEGRVKTSLLMLRERGAVEGEVETSGLRICGSGINISSLRLVQNE